MWRSNKEAGAEMGSAIAIEMGLEVEPSSVVQTVGVPRKRDASYALTTPPS